jgi:hypothetical protein
MAKLCSALLASEDAMATSCPNWGIAAPKVGTTVTAPKKVKAKSPREHTTRMSDQLAIEPSKN